MTGGPRLEKQERKGIQSCLNIIECRKAACGIFSASAYRYGLF